MSCDKEFAQGLIIGLTLGAICGCVVVIAILQFKGIL